MKATQRLTEILYAKKIPQIKIAEIAQTTPQAVNNWFKGKNKMRKEAMERILNHFPEINRNYVVHGKYDPLSKDPVSAKDDSIKYLLNKSFKGMSSKFFIQKMKMIQHQSRAMEDAAQIINELISDMLDDLNDEDFNDGKKKNVS